MTFLECFFSSRSDKYLQHRQKHIQIFRNCDGFLKGNKIKCQEGNYGGDFMGFCHGFLCKR